MAFQMRDMNKGYYNLTPLASSEMVLWNKERTSERVACARSLRRVLPRDSSHTVSYVLLLALACAGSFAAVLHSAYSYTSKQTSTCSGHVTLYADAHLVLCPRSCTLRPARSRHGAAMVPQSRSAAHSRASTLTIGLAKASPRLASPRPASRAHAHTHPGGNPGGLAPLPTFCLAGTGNTHAAEYSHFRASNDVFSDSVYGRPPSRFAPPRFNAAFNKAAGKAGEHGGHRIIVPQPVDPPLPRSQVMVGEKQPRWPAPRSSPFLYGKSGLYPSGSL